MSKEQCLRKARRLLSKGKTFYAADFFFAAKDFGGVIDALNITYPQWIANIKAGMPRTKIGKEYWGDVLKKDEENWKNLIQIFENPTLAERVYKYTFGPHTPLTVEIIHNAFGNKDRVWAALEKLKLPKKKKLAFFDFVSRYGTVLAEAKRLLFS